MQPPHPDRPARPPRPRVVDAPVIAHRGASALAPENTVPSLEAAARLGAAWVEVDVQLAADGELVVIHDLTLDRTTDGHRPVRAQTLAQLRDLDAGTWFSPAFADTRIPTLDEVLACCLDVGLCLQLELKPAPGDEAELTERAAASLRAAWPASRAAQALVTSFSPACLRHAARLLPTIARAVAVTAVPDDPWAVLRAADVQVLHILDDGIDLAAFRQLGTTGVEYAVAIVNDADRARALLAAGCQTVITDHPDLLAG